MLCFRQHTRTNTISPTRRPLPGHQFLDPLDVLGHVVMVEVQGQLLGVALVGQRQTQVHDTFIEVHAGKLVTHLRQRQRLAHILV